MHHVLPGSLRRVTSTDLRTGSSGPVPSIRVQSEVVPAQGSSVPSTSSAVRATWTTVGFRFSTAGGTSAGSRTTSTGFAALLR